MGVWTITSLMFKTKLGRCISDTYWPTWIEIVLSVRCAHQHALNIKKCNWDLQRCLRELADTENGRTSAVTETPTSNSWSQCPTFDLPSSIWAPDNQKSKDPWLAEQCFPQKPKGPRIQSKVSGFPTGFDGFRSEKADQWIDSRIHGVTACSSDMFWLAKLQRIVS